MFFNRHYLIWILLIGTCSSHGQLREVDAKSAGNFCEHGLATYNDFRSELSDLSFLKSGQSGWLSGGAVLSYTLSVEKCYNAIPVAIGINRSRIIDSRVNILAECIKYCNNTLGEYIGLQNNTCFCNLYNNLKKIKNTVTISKCQRACKIIPNYECERYLVIYRTLNTQHIRPNGVGQCVYISKNNNTLRYDSASCHNASGINVQDCFCHSKNNCSGQSQHQKYSMSEEHFLTWKEAHNICNSIDSSLINLASFQATSSYPSFFTPNRKYWSGGFRTISPVNYSSSNTCLAVRNVNASFFLDVDDCSASKVPICSIRSSTEMSKKSEKPSNGSKRVAVIVGLTSGILAVLVIIVCIVARCIKGNKTSNSNKTLITHGNNKITVSEDDDYAIVDENLLAEPSQSTISTVNTKNMSTKSERHTLTRQLKAMKADENVQLNSATEKKELHTGSQDTYDRVNMTQPNHHNDRSTPPRADLNIYDHTVHAANVYDVTSTRQKKIGANDTSTTPTTDLNIYDHTVRDLNVYDVTSTRQKTVGANDRSTPITTELNIYDHTVRDVTSTRQKKSFVYQPESDQIYNTTNI